MCAAWDRHEWSGPSGAPGMNCAGENLLAGAALTGEEDHRIERGRAPSGGHGASHRRDGGLENPEGAPDPAGGAVLAGRSLHADYAVEEALDLIQGERLDEGVVRSRPDGAYRIGDRPVCRHQDHG